MRFLTLSWWAGEDTSDRGSEYAAYLDSIWEKLPRTVQELSRIPCHDANVTHLALAVPTRRLLLNMELAGAKTGTSLSVRYRDVDHFVSTARPDEGLPGPGGYGDLGYDEVDVGDTGGFVHRLLFSNGIEIEITFGDVEIQEIPSSTAMSNSPPPMPSGLPTFRVTFRSHHTAGHCESYLNELLDFADWRCVSPLVYVLTPLRRNTVDHLRADLQRQRDLRRLTFEEIAA